MAYDDWVAASQEWVNDTYTGTPGFVPLTVNGLTGWPTMFALTRALQIELGISTPSDTFGPATLSALVVHYAEVTANTTNTNVIAILQCAFWCKGYAGGATFGTWSPTVEGSAVAVRAALGLPAQLIGKITPKMFKSLLSMDAYVRVGTGTNEARAVQQWLNGRYENKAEYYLMPCDGIYSRDVQRGLMLAIQYEVLPSTTTPNGALGPSTKAGIEAYGLFPNYATSPTSDGTGRPMRRLFQAALIFNKYLAPFNGTYNSTTNSVQKNFQSFAALSLTDGVNYATWASLLVSTGDPDRLGLASDTSTVLTQAKANTIYASGYRVVGRYLSVASKRVQQGELGIIFSAGLSVFPIFQESNNALSFFDEEQGFEQGKRAVRRARQLGFPAGSIIYFAVDFDATGDDITAKVLPHFIGIAKGVSTSMAVPYRIGVYGTRNVCSRISAAGIATRSFVAAMSTGWSGNLGFPLPANWAYDQIKTRTLGSGIGQVTIDNNIKALQTEPLTQAEMIPTPPVAVNQDLTSTFWLSTTLNHLAEIECQVQNALVPGILSMFDANDLVLALLQHHDGHYNDALWMAFTPLREIGLSVVDPARAAALTHARQAFNVAVADVNNFTSSDWSALRFGFAGQHDHFAATARSYLGWPAPTSPMEVALADTGGWALDLVQLWDDYEIQRTEHNYDQGAYTWAKTMLGNPVYRFPEPDLIADIDAYYVIYQLRANPSRSFADIIREIHIKQVDPHWRYDQFLALRFNNSKSNIVAAVTFMYSDFTNIAAYGPMVVFADQRLPGWPSGNATDPSAAVRATELADFAWGFADALFAKATP